MEKATVDQWEEFRPEGGGFHCGPLLHGILKVTIYSIWVSAFHRTAIKEWI